MPFVGQDCTLADSLREKLMKTAHLCISSGGMEESHGVGKSAWTPIRFVKGHPLRAHPRGDKACDQRKKARGRRKKEDNEPDRANSKY
jgi:hypothetical protein